MARTRRPRRAAPGLLARSRPRLVQQIGAGVRLPVTTVVAPAGSGKTMLVADWAEWAEGVKARPSAGAGIAWVALEPLDRNRELFWGVVPEALREATGVPEDHPMATSRPGNAVDDALLDGIADALDALGGPVVRWSSCSTTPTC